jgi:chromosome partitioning protein
LTLTNTYIVRHVGERSPRCVVGQVSQSDFFGALDDPPEVVYPRPRVAIILAVANQKGGVGKTTTSVNLAASLAAAERSTLLVDCDPQGNATSGSGVDRRAVERSIYDVLLGQASVDAAAMPTALARLQVVPATQDLVAAELELVDHPGRATILRDALALVKDRWDYVILDCPPSLGLLTVNALTAADRVIVPLQCEYFALEGLTHLMATIDRIRGALNPTLEVEGIVLTMFDGRNSLTHQVADEVRGHFHVFDTVIPRNVRLSEAPSHGKPALLYDAQSRGALAYLGLARELSDRLGLPQERSSMPAAPMAAAPVPAAPVPAAPAPAAPVPAAELGTKPRSTRATRGKAPKP